MAGEPGFEPELPGPEPGVLPLNYSPLKKIINEYVSICHPCHAEASGRSNEILGPRFVINQNLSFLRKQESILIIKKFQIILSINPFFNHPTLYLITINSNLEKFMLNLLLQVALQKDAASKVPCRTIDINAFQAGIDALNAKDPEAAAAMKGAVVEAQLRKRQPQQLQMKNWQLNYHLQVEEEVPVTSRRIIRRKAASAKRRKLRRRCRDV